MNSLVNDAKSLDEFIKNSDPAAMRLCVDIGFLAQAEIPMSKFVKEHKKRIGSVHIRDLKPAAGKKKKGEKSERSSGSPSSER